MMSEPGRAVECAAWLQRLDPPALTSQIFEDAYSGPQRAGPR